MSIQLLPNWVSTKTAAYNAGLMESVPCDTTGGTFAVTLPALTGQRNKTVRVKWRAGTVPPTIVAATGRTLDPTWTGFGQVGDSVDFSDDGATWNLI